jgi:hypothetical protein
MSEAIKQGTPYEKARNDIANQNNVSWETVRDGYSKHAM